LHEIDTTDRIPGKNKTNVALPGALPVTVNLGLFIKEDGSVTDTSINSLDRTLLRIKKILYKTPHTFRFVLPITYGTEEEIVKKILSGKFWKENSPPEIHFFRLKDDDRILKEPLLDDIPYEIKEISPKIKTYGYDPVSIAITEYSSLVIIIGTESEAAVTDEKNSYMLAKRFGRSVVSIHAETGRIMELPSDDRIFNSYAKFNFYNSTKINPAKFSAEKDRYITNLRNDLRLAGFEEESIQFSYESLLPHYIKARVLGTRYNFLHTLKGILVALLAALAIFTITMQTLFFPENPGLVWIEVVIIGVIIFLLVASRIGDYHLKSIDYNFLAERIRNAFFSRIICISCQITDNIPLMTPMRTPNDWMVMAFDTIVTSGEMISCNKEISLEPLREFIISAWIRKRLNFYQKEADKARFRYNLLANSAVILFLVTMILAIAHAMGVGHLDRLSDVEIPLIMAFFTITIPAFGAAITAIRVQREYHRNSVRYSQIIRHLTAIITEMEYATDVGELCTLVKEMNEMTFREAHDWKILSRYNITE